MSATEYTNLTVLINDSLINVQSFPEIVWPFSDGQTKVTRKTQYYIYSLGVCLNLSSPAFKKFCKGAAS